jgi:nucleoside-diphosphate-sugar epimerase
MAANAMGVENIAAACAGCARPPTLVVVSSLAAAGPCAADSLRVESDVPTPISNYGRSKLAGEQAAARYAGAVPTTIVRPPVVFGPGDRAVLEVFRTVLRLGVHVVPGWRGGGARDMRVSLVHVDDLVDGLVLAAGKGERLCGHSAGEPGRGIYFIAGDERPTYAGLGPAIAAALGSKPPALIRVPGPLLRLAGVGGEIIALLRRKPGWISRDKVTEALADSWVCSSGKAQRQLGWSPTSPLPDRLRETARWYRESGWL